MLLEMPRHTEIFGSVKVHELQRVLKLDSGGFENPRAKDISSEELKGVLKRSAIVVPVKNENLNLLDGVLRAIPFDCSIIVVSNSERVSQDTYKMERELVTNTHDLTQQEILIIHQKDPGLGSAFHEVGYEEILEKEKLDGKEAGEEAGKEAGEETGKEKKEWLVRDGKSEGMIIGMLLAKSLGKDFIGFADADNFVPGAVREYVMDFAAGFCMSESPFSMVRLHWRYKPKVVEDKLYFKKWGRVSETTNKYLNLLISTCTGFETGVVITGNAGEHALTTRLADLMCYSTGYTIEPYHFVFLFDKFGPREAEESAEKVGAEKAGAEKAGAEKVGAEKAGTEKAGTEKASSEAANAGIEIFQIETLNPHLHEEKGEAHINEMLTGSLRMVYNCRLCNDYVKSKVLAELEGLEALQEDWEARSRWKGKPSHIMPPVGRIDVGKFMKVLKSSSESLLRCKQGATKCEVVERGRGEKKNETSSFYRP